MMTNIKRIDITEFREFGYLQELNRQFLHPLGLALEVIVNEDGTESLGGIWDCRDDEEGIHYDLENSDEDRIYKFRKNAERVNNEWATKHWNRRKKLGYMIEPII